MASQNHSIAQIAYGPPGGYGLDIEVLPAALWRARIPAGHWLQPTRIAFHQWVLVTRGQYTHTVDFASLGTRAGEVLAMHPGQVQRFQAPSAWEGWVLIFKPDAKPMQAGAHSLPQALQTADQLPTQLALDQPTLEAVQEALARMAADAQRGGNAVLLRALLQSQLQALMLRLLLAAQALQPESAQDSVLQQRFNQLREAIEQHLHQWHQVAHYARHLGVSEKTLGRATLELAGLSAKAYLSQRIALEAKRLLAYTDWPVSRVADKLGFDEATNFVKFFRRETGQAPSAFRQGSRQG